jgi:8-oxo-dGTP diphosphatase
VNIVVLKSAGDWYIISLYGEKEGESMKITEVVAALIWREDRFLICRRPAHKARGLLWEFVGGKVEPGESKQAALIRECREELAVELQVGDVFMDVTHVYPDITVHLTLFHATIAEGEPQMLEHCDMRWITPAETEDFEFCPADVEILEKIKNNY